MGGLAGVLGQGLGDCVDVIIWHMRIHLFEVWSTHGLSSYFGFFFCLGGCQSTACHSVVCCLAGAEVPRYEGFAESGRVAVYSPLFAFLSTLLISDAFEINGVYFGAGGA